MIQALGFFILGVVSDAIIALYYLAISRGWPELAALLSVLIGGLGYFIIRKIVVVWRPRLIMAELLGCAVGTYIIVRFL
jgi:hypothetical protein